MAFSDNLGFLSLCSKSIFLLLDISSQFGDLLQIELKGSL